MLLLLLIRFAVTVSAFSRARHYALCWRRSAPTKRRCWRDLRNTTRPTQVRCSYGCVVFHTLTPTGWPKNWHTLFCTPYLCQIFTDFRRQLRSSDIATFVIPRIYTCLGDRAFPVAGNDYHYELKQSLTKIEQIDDFSLIPRWYDNRVFHIGRPTQLLDHGCWTAFRPTYDSLTLPFNSSTGR